MKIRVVGLLLIIHYYINTPINTDSLACAMIVMGTALVASAGLIYVVDRIQKRR